MVRHSEITFTVEDAPNPADIQSLWAQLLAYNCRHAEADNHQPLAVSLRDPDGNIAGGLSGGTYWGWLHIDALWLREDPRSQGYGRRLVAAAEAEAVRRGCRHAYVDTHDFQAPEFYEKLGYVRWDVLEDLPPGHVRIFLRKELG